MSELNQTTNIYSNSAETDSVFSTQNVLIIVLLFIIIFILLGSKTLPESIKDLLSMVGFTAGEIVNNSADLFGNAAVTGIDIAKGATHSIGDLLINKTIPNIDPSKQSSLREIVGIPKIHFHYRDFEPKPMDLTNSTSLQKLIASKIIDKNKCISGRLFSTQTSCLNPDDDEDDDEDDSPDSSGNTNAENEKRFPAYISSLFSFMRGGDNEEDEDDEEKENKD